MKKVGQRYNTYSYFIFFTDYDHNLGSLYPTIFNILVGFEIHKYQGTILACLFAIVCGISVVYLFYSPNKVIVNNSVIETA